MAQAAGIGAAGTPQTALAQNERVSGTRASAERSAAVSKEYNQAAKAAVSSTGGALASAVLQSGDDVRTGKVEQIRNAIAAGTYQVPAGAVADKLIQHLLG